MKIRITSDQIRFRLSDSEVGNLGTGNSLFLSVHLGSGSQTMNYEIITSTDTKNIQANHLEGSLRITLPEDQAHLWFQNNEEGLYTTIKTEIGSQLNIAIEKDYPCKH